MNTPPGLSQTDLFAEPPPKSRYWFQAAYGRLVFAGSNSRPPILVTDSDLLRRAELAGLSHAPPPSTAPIQTSPLVIGSRAPGLVLVGDRAPRGQRPFWSRSGVWLLAGLRVLGYDELTLLLTNAYTRDGEQVDLEPLRASLPPCPWVALGELAHRVLRNVVYAQHPNWHRRFRYREGPAGYAALLERAGVQRGAWYGGPLPLRQAPAAQPAIGAWAGLPEEGIAYRKEPRGSSTPQRERVGSGSVAADRAETARRAYVTGEAATLKDAAELIQTSVDIVRELARRDGWEEEREDHRRKARERAYAAAAEAEAKSISAARRLAWGGATKALADVVQRLKDGTLEASTGDAQRLVDIACTLSGKGDAGQDSELERLRAMPVTQLAEELTRVVRAQFGDPAQP